MLTDRTDGRANGRTEIWTPISHPAISRCDKKSLFIVWASFLNDNDDDNDNNDVVDDDDDDQWIVYL